MSTYEELLRMEAWRRRVEAAGYRVLVEAWSPAPPAPGVRRGPRGAS